ncbi:hypothetical protein BASA81_007529 [Batrachochytrium salamandrivorans]|nr:hypothetical protein BASA81_007529 [Batrachochytrium salamandrivorans]
MKKVSRPLSSAASFFRKNGAGTHRSIPRPAVPPTSSTVSGLNSTPEELSHLHSTVFPLLVNFLGNGDTGLEGLFLVDPSASSQEAMMGLTDPSQREPVRALRELLESRFVGGSEQAILQQHHVYVWAISLKLLLKELVAKKTPILTPVAVGMLDESQNKPNRLSFLQQRRFADFVSVSTCNLFHVLHRCRTSKEKLGFVFAVLLFTGEYNVEQMSKTTQFLIANAEELFGPTPFADVRAPSSSGGQLVSISSTTPPPPQTTSKTFLFLATCTFDFDPESQDELELRIGDSIEVTECVDEDWFRGRLRLPDGTMEEGLFPSAFVKRDVPVSQLAPSTLFVPPPPSTLFVAPAPALVSVPDPALFAAPPPPPPPAQPVMVSASQPVVASPQQGNGGLEPILAVVLFDFTAEEEGELSLAKGEKVVILDQTDPDWWLGKRVSDGAQGLFPFNYADIQQQQALFPAAAPFTAPAAVDSPALMQFSTPPVQPQMTTVSPPLMVLPPPMPPGPKPAPAASASLQRGNSNRGGRPRPPPPPNPINIVLPGAPKPSPLATSSYTPLPSSSLLPQSTRPFTAPLAVAPLATAPLATAPLATAPLATLPSASLPDIPLAIADPAANGWTITADAFNKYVGFFNEQPKEPTSGKVLGRDMANFLVQSGLPKSTIAQVLELSDLDKDQRFDSHEFALAMHLSLCIAKRKMPLPTSLPNYLIPASKRHLVH